MWVSTSRCRLSPTDRARATGSARDAGPSGRRAVRAGATSAHGVVARRACGRTEDFLQVPPWRAGPRPHRQRTGSPTTGPRRTGSGRPRAARRRGGPGQLGGAARTGHDGVAGEEATVLEDLDDRHHGSPESAPRAAPGRFCTAHAPAGARKSSLERLAITGPIDPSHRRPGRPTDPLLCPIRTVASRPLEGPARLQRTAGALRSPPGRSGRVPTPPPGRH